MQVYSLLRGARGVAFTAAFALSALAASYTQAQTASWPQWRGADRTNCSPDKNLLDDWSKTKPQLLWQAEGIGTGYASVSVVDGVVYTLDASLRDLAGGGRVDATSAPPPPPSGGPR